jgi:hypothetical protein
MNINDITSDTITSVAELIDLDESLSYATNHPHRLAFRGQPRDFGTLAPSFQRQFSRQSIGTAELIEGKLISAFREHYAKLKDRSQDMPAPDRIGQHRDLRCLSVMQHYEIPTRLLDWTSNFWTAIYFATASDPGSKAELWIYDRYLFQMQRDVTPLLSSLTDPSTDPPPEPPVLNRRGEDLIVELDPQITPRMKQQAAHHTVSGDVFADHAPLILSVQQRFRADNETAPKVRRVLIDASCKGKALQFLADHKDITASTIFPDVVGLGRFLRWQFESLRTMLL